VRRIGVRTPRFGGGGVAVGRPLLEREHELALVAGLVDAARAGEGAALVIEGPAGIGKTGLLASTCRSAAERQLTVLRAGRRARQKILPAASSIQ
jgi:predicted ATP-dependent serine protease